MNIATSRQIPLTSTLTGVNPIPVTDYTVDIIIPVYKNVALTKICLDSIRDNLGEISDYFPRIILINDSPDDIAVTKLLDTVAKSDRSLILISNDANLGFIKSVNRGLAVSRAAKRAAILVNSDTKTFKGTLANLLKAANSDAQIAFACPRSNNASLSTIPRLPHPLGGVSIGPEQSYNNWSTLSRWLPEVSYVPTAVGFYLYIKKDVVTNFGWLDESFGLGYEEENDLIMRANDVGYRAVLANHSFAYHAGSASFLLQDLALNDHKLKNLQRLSLRHPQFRPLVHKYESSPEFIAEGLLKNLLPSRAGSHRMAINLINMGQHHNGSNELAYCLIREIAAHFANKFDLTLICSAATAKFHELDKIKNITCTEDINGDYAIAVSLGQPFDLHFINVMESLAPINIYGMLDVIALDCGYLSIQKDIDRYWRYVAECSSGVFCISQFSKTTYLNRFPKQPEQRMYAKILPTKLYEYGIRYENARHGQEHILVLGNHFTHKDSDLTAKRVADRLTNCQVVVLGEKDFTHGNLRSFRAGTVPDESMISLFSKASAIILPSYYEGFGFGLLHGLSLHKPVVARDIPATREILETFRTVSGVYLYCDNDDVVDLITRAVDLGSSTVDDSLASSWNDWAGGFVDFCKGLLASADVYSRLVDRIREGKCLREYTMLKGLLESRNTDAVAIEDVLPPSQLPHEVASIPMVAELRSPTQGIQSVDDLLKKSDADFIEAAYEKLLMRKADISGANHYLQKLRSGYSKIRIIRDLRNSQEGTVAAAELAGLDDIADTMKQYSIRGRFLKALGMVSRR